MKLTTGMLSELDAEDVCVCGHVRRQHLSEQPKQNHNGCFSFGCDCPTFSASPFTEQSKGCRRCTVCEGLDHHWMEECDDDHPEGIMACKHCPATRDIEDKDYELPSQFFGKDFCPHPDEPCIDGCAVCGRKLAINDHEHTRMFDYPEETRTEGTGRKVSYECVCSYC